MDSSLIFVCMALIFERGVIHAAMIFFVRIMVLMSVGTQVTCMFFDP